MSKILIIILCLCIPMSAFCDGMHFDKETILNKANTHYEEGIDSLKKAQSLCWYIPDLEKRRHLEALICGFFTSLYVKSMQAKILSAALPLIGDLVSDAYTKYRELNTHLRNAQYHLDMANFYDQLSVNVKMHKSTDKGTLAFFSAIDHLTFAIACAQSIHPNFECVLQQKNIAVLLINQRKLFMENQANVATRAYNFYIFMRGILNECEHGYKGELEDNLKQMAYKMTEAEKLWNKK